MLEASIQMVAYVGGEIQVRQAVERSSSSHQAVGRLGCDSLQHSCTNPQSVSEKPGGWASNGFSGRPPLSIAGTGVQTNIR